MKEEAAKTAGDNFNGFMARELYIIESPTPMTKTALIVRCFISVGLNLNLARVRDGVYVTLYSKGGASSLGALAFSICGQA